MGADKKVKLDASKTSEKKREKFCEHQAIGTVMCSKCGLVVVEQIICGISELIYAMM